MLVQIGGRMYKIFFLLGLILFAGPIQADEFVNILSANFVKQLPADWKYEVGHWEYFDVKNCFQGKKSCAGSNPTSPYGYPTFLNPTTGTFDQVFQVSQNEAIVLFFRTPPQMRYFGFTQYLMQNHNDPSTVFASLSDTLNLAKLGTSGANLPGAAPFNAYSAIIWTANINTFNSLKQMFINLDFPETAINFLPLPVSIPSFDLSLGYGATADTFSMLMRAALPTNQTDFNSYIAESPFFVGKFRPQLSFAFSPAPTIGFSDDISGINESLEYTNLSSALNSLVNDIKRNYSSIYSLKKLSVEYATKTGWNCILEKTQCAGDNFDALYSFDTKYPVVVKNLNDFIIIAGVNHQKTGKVTYLNHSVYDTVHFAGITSIADTSLNVDSALYHAGVVNKITDIRRITYKNLYAYIISYNCDAKSFCLSIPAPTSENPVGLTPGAPFMVIGRDYLDPKTLVRPSSLEIIPHQVFSATKY